MSKQVDESTVDQVHAEHEHSGSRLGAFLVVIAFIALVGVFGFGYFQLAKNNMALTQQVSSIQQQISDSATHTQSLSQTVEQLQQSNPQELQTAILNRWYVSEAQY